jgi:GTP pyrophosphokinase
MKKTLNEKVILGTRMDWTEEEKKLLKKAVEFAIHKHEGQERRSGEPYVNHTIETGRILAQLGMDSTTIASGVLHDILEDTQTTEEEFEKEFGPEIAFLVKGVSKLTKLKYSGVERHVESLRKFFVAMAEDIRVVIIKLADRLHNISTLEFVKKEKQQRIALETLEIHARLADRLGMGQLKTELEEMSFPYALPEEYKQVKEISKSYIRDSGEKMDEVKNNIRESLELEGVNVIRIESRIKHLYSLFLKLKKREAVQRQFMQVAR